MQHKHMKRAANSQKPEVLALIPARGVGTSEPHRDLLRLGGKPLIAYSVQHALACPSITRTIVSTNDEEIAEAAWDAGAEVPFRRPAGLAADGAALLTVFRHALEWLAEKENYHPELVVHLVPSQPVRDPNRIDHAVQQMLGCPQADSLKAVGVAEQSPYKMWVRKRGCLQPLLALNGVTDAHATPQEQLSSVYIQNGYVDIVRPRTILSLGSMVGRHVLAFVVDQGVMEDGHKGQIPELERAVARAQAGTLFREASARQEPDKRFQD